MGANAKKQSNKNHFTIKQITKQQRYYKYFATGLGAFLLAYVCASTLAPVQNSDAAQQIVIDNQLSDYSITITIPDDVVNIPVSALPGGQLAAKKTSVNIKTDSPSGYKLYLSSSTLDNNLYKDSDSSTSSSGYFAPTSGSTSAPVALTQNTWGFALDKTAVPDNTAPSVTNIYAQNFADLSNYNTGTNTPTTSSTWAQVPKSDDPVAILQNTKANDAIGGENLDIYYGVNASTALPSGSYGASVTYTAISEGVNSFDTMQDFTAEQCDNLGTDSSINLTDSRDGKYYRITKLKDGHCWMTQNLSLDGTDKSGNIRTLTPNDSNVTTNRKLAENIADGTDNSGDSVQIYSGNTDNTTQSCLSTAPYCVVSNNRYGNLYNWSAATAGVGSTSSTGTVTESICPKGWRLPDVNGDFSYANLVKAYGLGDGENKTNAGEYVKAVQQAPLNFPLAGVYDGRSAQQGVYTYYWTRTIYVGNDGDRTTAYDFIIDTRSNNNGLFAPKFSNVVRYGMSVRCVFGGQADDTMQTFTTTMCNNLAESTATADNRKTMIDSRDGKFYKISKLADGNCWMVSNLALDGMDALGTVRTLTPSDSNVTQNHTLATNITSGTASNNTQTQIYSGVANDTTTQKNYDYAVVSDIKYGNLYNWMAATAGTGTASMTGTNYESVCPTAGGSETWRLPDNGTATGAKTYSNLLDTYNLPTNNGIAGSAVQTIQQAPLYSPLTGTYDISAIGQGYSANYWSRTPVSSTSTNAYCLVIHSDSGYFGPQSPTKKGYGSSVRCVLGD